MSGTGSVPLRKPRSCAPPSSNGANRHGGFLLAHEECTDSFGTIDLVRSETGQIDREVREVERDSSDRLRGVTMNKYASLSTQ